MDSGSLFSTSISKPAMTSNQLEDIIKTGVEQQLKTSSRCSN